MSESYELDYCGIPAGEVVTTRSDEGHGWIWIRPDQQRICRSGYGSEMDAAEALVDAVSEHYGRMQ